MSLLSFLSSFSGRYFKSSADTMKTIYIQAEWWSVCLHHLLVTGCIVTAGDSSRLSRMKEHHYRISCSLKKEIPMACFIYRKLIHQHLHPGSLLTSSLSPLSPLSIVLLLVYLLHPPTLTPFLLSSCYLNLTHSQMLPSYFLSVFLCSLV